MSLESYSHWTNEAIEIRELDAIDLVQRFRKPNSAIKYLFIKLLKPQKVRGRWERLATQFKHYRKQERDFFQICYRATIATDRFSWKLNAGAPDISLPENGRVIRFYTDLDWNLDCDIEYSPFAQKLLRAWQESGWTDDAAFLDATILMEDIIK